MSHFNFHFAHWESQQVLYSDIAKKSFEIAKDENEKNRESLLTF